MNKLVPTIVLLWKLQLRSSANPEGLEDPSLVVLDVGRRDVPADCSTSGSCCNLGTGVKVTSVSD